MPCLELAPHFSGETKVLDHSGSWPAHKGLPNPSRAYYPREQPCSRALVGRRTSNKEEESSVTRSSFSGRISHLPNRVVCLTSEKRATFRMDAFVSRLSHIPLHSRHSPAFSVAPHIYVTFQTRLNLYTSRDQNCIAGSNYNLVKRAVFREA